MDIVVEVKQHSPEYINECKEKIQKLLAEQKEKYNLLKRDYEQPSRDGMGDLDKPRNVMDGVSDEVIWKNKSEEMEVCARIIQDYKNALLRIENGTYAICPETKKPISKEKLAVNICAILSAEGELIRRKKTKN